jgi:23S rRNA (guanosine2251-2'-O)-methyltransferase
VVSISETQIEGRNAVIEAIKAKRPVNKIYIKKGERQGSIFKIIKLAKQAGIPIQEVDTTAFNSMVKTGGHQGVIALAPPKEYVDVSEIIDYAKKLKEDPFILILNELTDPQNFGNIMRTAECLGVHGIIIPKHRACGVTPTVIMVSAGAAEYINVARVTNISSTIDYLKQEGIWVIGADAQGENYYSVDLTGPMALVIGGEDKGLGKLVKQKCDMLIRIPMKGKINSLNAATSAAILGYDILRQRIMKNG